MSASRPIRILVVCTGNTCRTPMAEALLRQRLAAAGIPADVRSAGTHAWEGAPAQPDAAAVARGAGLDLSAHRAHLLDEEGVRWADVVLGMAPDHVRRALELDSTALAHMITEYDETAPTREGIMDPMGWEREVYAAVFAQIESCVKGFVRRLVDSKNSERG